MLPPPDRHKAYAQRLALVDPALGKTYQGIWEALYGTDADPERAATYLMRQAFDHFFSKFAPDDAVRNSPSRQKNVEGKKDNQVTRSERLEFTAVTHIGDPVKAEALMVSIKHMVAVYSSLNRAHDRGELDRGKARQVLNEMRSILEDWIDAIKIPQLVSQD